MRTTSGNSSKDSLPLLFIQEDFNYKFEEIATDLLS
jgi:hypothetical protein